MFDPRRNDIGEPNVERTPIEARQTLSDHNGLPQQNPAIRIEVNRTESVLDHVSKPKCKYTIQTDSSIPRSRSHLHFGSSSHLCAVAGKFFVVPKVGEFARSLSGFGQLRLCPYLFQFHARRFGSKKRRASSIRPWNCREWSSVTTKTRPEAKILLLPSTSRGG